VGLKSLKSLNLTNGYPNKNKNKNKNNKNNKVKSKPLELRSRVKITGARKEIVSTNFGHILHSLTVFRCANCNAKNSDSSIPKPVTKFWRVWEGAKLQPICLE
jgi:hypothetical protein